MQPKYATTYILAAASDTCTIIRSYLPHDFLNIDVPGRPAVYNNSWVQRMNAAGFSVCGMDQQGAGRSGGIRFYCEKYVGV